MKNKEFDLLLLQAGEFKKNRNYKDALICYRNAEENCPDLLNDQNHIEIFDTAYKAGNAALNHFHNYMDAIANFEYALSKLKIVKLPEDKYYKLFRNFALALHSAFQKKKAMEANLQAEEYIKKAEQHDEDYLQRIFRDRGSILISMRNFKDGLQLYVNTMEYFRKRDKGPFLSVIKLLIEYYLWTDKNLKKADGYLKEAFVHEKWKYFPKKFYGYLGVLKHLEKKYEESERHFQKYLKCLSEKKGEDIYYRFGYHYSYILSRKKKGKAVEMACRTINVLEKRRLENRDILFSSLFLKQHYKSYQGLFYLLLRIKPSEAFLVLIKMKCYFNLVEDMMKGYAVEMEKLIDFDDSKIEDFIEQKAVKKKILDYKYDYYNVPDISLEKIQGSLLKGEVMLDFFYDSKKIYIFRISREEFNFRIVNPKEEVFRTVQKTRVRKRKILSNMFSLKGQKQGYKNLLSYTEKHSPSFLWKQAKNQLDTLPCEKIYFIPYRRLHAFGFQNLISPGKKMLNTEKEISLISNPMLKKKKKYSREIKVGLLCNNTLRFAGKEIKEIKSRFGHVDLNTFDAISRNLERFNILHIAAHFYLQKNFYDSFLVIRQKIKVYCRDLKKLSFEKKRIILNVCESGKKQRMVSEEYLDLARLFITCGAEEVLASVEPISDIMGYNFISEFYSFLKPGKSFSYAVKQVLKKNPDFALVNPYVVRE